MPWALKNQETGTLFGPGGQSEDWPLARPYVAETAAKAALTQLQRASGNVPFEVVEVERDAF